MADKSKKRTDLSLQEKKNILECYDKLPKMSQRNAAVHLKVSQPLLCKILKNRASIETAQMSNQNMHRKRERCGKDDQVESALKMWFTKVRERNAPVNGPIMCQKAEEIAKTMGKDFVATDGWFNRWKRRENIVFKQLHGEEKSADYVAANEWIKSEWPKIIAEYSPEDIYNADETGLYFRAMPDHTYLFKSETSKGFKMPKERVTVLCCVSMAGEKRGLLVIGKSKNPRCFKGVKKLPVEYVANANAWMTSSLFSNWLIKWDLELNRKIILLVDNCTAHSNSLSLKNIQIIFLPANTTSLIQPCDQGIIRTLKAYYRRQIREKIINELDKDDQLDANAIARKISLLDAIHLLASSWKHVSKKTIENCFGKGGFLKPDHEITAEVELENAESFIGDMSKDTFENWIEIDASLEVAGPVSLSEICKQIDNDMVDPRCTSSNSEDEEEHEILEPPPSGAEMRDALRILRRGVQYRATHFHKQYEYEEFINELLNSNKKQTTIDMFFQ